MTHGAKNVGSFSEMMSPSKKHLKKMTNYRCIQVKRMQSIQIFFQDWWVEVTHGAKNGWSFSEVMSPSKKHLKKKINYRLIQVKSMQSILQSFPPALSYHL